MSAAPHPSRSSRRHWLRWAIILVVILILWGVGSRLYESHKLRHHAKEASVTDVLTTKPVKMDQAEEIVLPGTIQAWHDAPIYARTSGYLKFWKTDIGAKVKAGDLLAEIETPEVDAQYRQAKADLATAVANEELAQVTAKRWTDLLQTDSVSRQEADEKVSDAKAKQAMVLSQKSNVERLEELESFKHIVAPFDGTITARSVDTGSLINAGAGSSSQQELFHIAVTDKLRIYVQVPQNYTSGVAPGLTAELHFMEHPGKSYPAKFERSADALDPNIRTLLTQFTVDNRSGELYAGGYTEAHIKLPTDGQSVRIPVNTMLFRSHGLQVATIDPQNRIVLKSAVVGRDYGKEVEIVSGLSADDTIVVNPPDSMFTGEAVNVVQPESKKKDAQSGQAEADTGSGNSTSKDKKSSGSKKDSSGSKDSSGGSKISASDEKKAEKLEQKDPSHKGEVKSKEDQPGKGKTKQAGGDDSLDADKRPKDLPKDDGRP